MARIVRGQILSLKTQQFVLAGESTAEPSQYHLQHLLPNLVWRWFI
jgi:ABC-type dipeptide/oligopeptide/nickel transport system permease subunit